MCRAVATALSQILQEGEWTTDAILFDLWDTVVSWRMQRGISQHIAMELYSLLLQFVAEGILPSGRSETCRLRYVCRSVMHTEGIQGHLRGAHLSDPLGCSHDRGREEIY